MADFIKGRATPEATAAFVDRQIARNGRSPEHYRKRDLGAGPVYFSTIGIGTYLGAGDDATDASYTAAIALAISLGGNVVDTASNYRNQRSERAVGAALRRVAGEASRDAVIVASKAGFIPFDGEMPDDPKRFVEETYITPGIFSADDIVGGCHVMTPRFLDFQFEKSRANLGLETLDIYFLHNIEMQRAALGAEEFGRRLRAAAAALEEKCAAGRLSAWGAATWDGLRAAPDRPEFLALEELLAAAREVAGDGHHCRAVQLPYNLAMTEAHAFANQPDGPAQRTVLEFAQAHGLTVLCSAANLQGKLRGVIPPEVARAFPEAQSDVQRALQFVRSTPGVTTALCGMSRAAHVQENFRLASSAPKTAALLSLYRAD